MQAFRIESNHVFNQVNVNVGFINLENYSHQSKAGKNKQHNFDISTYSYTIMVSKWQLIKEINV